MKRSSSSRGREFPKILIGAFILTLSFLLLAMFFLPSPVALAKPLEQTDPVISFSGSNIVQLEPESNQVIPLTVLINPAISNSTVVTVEVQTVNGSATAGSDYTAINGQIITFSQGVSSRTVNVTILPDTLSEPRENFFVQLKNPVNATLGANASFVVNIELSDPPATATNTPTSNTGATPIYIDVYEGNDTIQTAYSLDTVFTSGCTVDKATFWPAGDVDFYRFWAQGSASYTISTAQLSPGLDSVMTLYNPEGQVIATSDDSSPGVRTSTIQFTPAGDAWHYIGLINEDPSNPAGKTYCVTISEIAPTVTPSPIATATFVQSAVHDACKSELSYPDNDIPEYACVISSNDTQQDNFVPREEGIRDIDYYRMWVKEGNFYTCDTIEALAEFNDTKMKFLNQDRGLIAENDDFDASGSGSKLSYLSTYTGWMYVLVEPTINVEYRIADKYTYTLTCSSQEVTPTFTPRPIQPGTGGGGGSNPPTATPSPTIEEVATIDVLATVQAASTPTLPPTPTPNISINPLPTEAPPVTPVFSADLQVILFYDSNQNNLPEIDEGIVDMAVLAKDGNTGDLLALGYTNQAGVIRFNLTPSAQTINIVIPYLSINQTVSVGASELLIRVAPSTLPNNLP